jgi:hypothetical protein
MPFLPWARVIESMVDMYISLISEMTVLYTRFRMLFEMEWDVK